MAGCACSHTRNVFARGELRKMHQMYGFCAVVVLCCAFSPRCSAAPKTWRPDPRSEPERDAERDDGLQEEADGRESILSKVRGSIPLSHVFANISSQFRA